MKHNNTLKFSNKGEIYHLVITKYHVFISDLYNINFIHITLITHEVHLTGAHVGIFQSSVMKKTTVPELDHNTALNFPGPQITYMWFHIISMVNWNWNNVVCKTEIKRRSLKNLLLQLFNDTRVWATSLISLSEKKEETVILSWLITKKRKLKNLTVKKTKKDKTVIIIMYTACNGPQFTWFFVCLSWLSLPSRGCLQVYQASTQFSGLFKHFNILHWSV